MASTGRVLSGTRDGTVDARAAQYARISPISPSIACQFVGGDPGFGAYPPLLHDLCVLFHSGQQAHNGGVVTSIASSTAIPH